MPNLQHDTQMVSILYRTHKSLPNSCKVSSLYVFDALARSAKQQANKQNDAKAASFLSKLGGVVDGLYRGMQDPDIPEGKVSKQLSSPPRSNWSSCSSVTGTSASVTKSGTLVILKDIETLEEKAPTWTFDAVPNLDFCRRNLKKFSPSGLTRASFLRSYCRVWGIS